MRTYRSDIVDQSLDLFGGLLDAPFRNGLVREHLERLADLLWMGIRQGHPYAARSLTNHHPEFSGKELGALPAPERLELSDARSCIAAEYGFGAWPSVMESDARYAPDLEAATDALIQGEAIILEELLKQRPELTTMRSPYGHGATLLHYCASNGVEIWRQQVPENIAGLATLLLEHGADPQARMRVYGGAFTAHELAATSVHPKAAGVREALLSSLAT